MSSGRMTIRWRSRPGPHEHGEHPQVAERQRGRQQHGEPVERDGTIPPHATRQNFGPGSGGAGASGSLPPSLNAQRLSPIAELMY
jgi:hypothetical protein